MLIQQCLDSVDSKGTGNEFWICSWLSVYVWLPENKGEELQQNLLGFNDSHTDLPEGKEILSQFLLQMKHAREHFKWILDLSYHRISDYRTVQGLNEKQGNVIKISIIAGQDDTPILYWGPYAWHKKCMLRTTLIMMEAQAHTLWLPRGLTGDSS